MKSSGSSNPPEFSTSPSLSSSSSTLSSTLQYASSLLPASMDPSEFASQFSILRQLSENRDAYQQDDVQLTIYHFPSVLLMLVDQTREQVPASLKFPSKPGRNPTILCCLSHGIGAISSHRDVRALLKLRSKLNRVQETATSQERRLDADLMKAVWSALDTFPVSMPSGGYGGKRQGLTMGQDLKKILFGVKTDLSLSFDSLSILCMMVSLCEQEWVHEEIREEMRVGVEGFFRMAKVRGRVMEVLLEELER